MYTLEHHRALKILALILTFHSISHAIRLLKCSIKRSNCYMVCAGETMSPGQGRNNNGLEIGCLVDAATGVLSFTANGKELSTYYQVIIFRLPFFLRTYDCVLFFNEHL